MIVYLDPSAFMTLYLEEEGSETIREVVDAAVGICAHLVTYVEMCTAFAQALRMHRLTHPQQVYQKDRFEADWAALHVLSVDEPLVRRAGTLAEGFALRGLDCVHLAAAERVWLQAPDNFQLAAFDIRLVRAARTLGIGVC